MNSGEKNTKMSSRSSESDNTVCPSSKNNSGTIEGSSSRTLTAGRLSNRSSTTRIVQYINDATYIERPCGTSARDITEVSDFDDKTFSCPGDRRSTSTFSVQICTVDENEELLRIRKEKYNEWLTNKKQIEARKKLEAKLKADQEMVYREMKQKKSEEKVKEWMKKHPVCNDEKKNCGNQAQKPKTKSARKKSRNWTNYEEWVQAKKKQEKAAQQKKEAQKRFIQQVKEYRQSLANAFYSKWCDFSKDKPLPVPLNRGFASLSSPNNSLYFNPIPWQID